MDGRPHSRAHDSWWNAPASIVFNAARLDSIGREITPMRQSQARDRSGGRPDVGTWSS